ncbi:hypothetical protein [Flavihumibacter sp. CACIAM 22H1]|uniref:hypothetical protein n=1 Tax=Flavihumibacter sp. CACIAM 22H1 TaxID=1812911 RepID=UPI0025BC4B0C|nr:hypothetical protein [Flavihumibacter sp. CACIAM 22H1]
MTKTTPKAAGKSKKINPWVFLLVLGLIGLGIFLVYKYRFVIAGWFSASNSTDGPSDRKTQELIHAALNNTGGINNPTPPNVTPKKPPYWPLKKGSKNDHVRWVQIMVNKIPNTGGRLVEDGNWGAKTDAKVLAASSFFGLKGLRIEQNDFFKMMCKTWPDSSSCKRIEKDWIETIISGE